MIISWNIWSAVFNKSIWTSNNAIREDWWTMLGFNDFEIMASCENMRDSDYILKEIDIKDLPNIEDDTITDESFEGVKFLWSNYSAKEITVTVMLNPKWTKSVANMIDEVKDSLHKRYWTLSYWYRWELMTTQASVQTFKTNLISKIKQYTVRFTTQPYFESSVEYSSTHSFTWSTWTISLGNAGHRIEPILTIEPTWDCESCTIWSVTIKWPFQSWDVISYDYGTNKATLDWVWLLIEWKQTYLWRSAEFDITFNESIVYPVLNQSVDSLNWIVLNNDYYVSNNYNDFWQNFSTNTIDYLKKIDIRGENMSAYSFKITASIYNTEWWTLLTTVEKNVYWWSLKINDFWDNDDLKITIEWEGLNVSTYSSLYLKLRFDDISDMPYDNTTFFEIRRTESVWTDPWQVEWVTQTFTLWVFLEGISEPYESSTTNASQFDVSLTYKNKYV